MGSANYTYHHWTHTTIKSHAFFLPYWCSTSTLLTLSTHRLCHKHACHHHTHVPCPIIPKHHMCHKSPHGMQVYWVGGKTISHHPYIPHHKTHPLHLEYNMWEEGAYQHVAPMLPAFKATKTSCWLTSCTKTWVAWVHDYMKTCIIQGAQANATPCGICAPSTPWYQGL